jgi:hypothetical protein
MVSGHQHDGYVIFDVAHLLKSINAAKRFRAAMMRGNLSDP